MKVYRVRNDILDEDRLMPLSCTVWEEEPYEEKTGLVNDKGLNIYRLHQRNPIGFIYLKEGDA